MAFFFTPVNRRFLDIPGGWQFSGPKLTISAWMYRISNSLGNQSMIVGKYPGQGAQRLRFMTSTDHLQFGANWNAAYSVWQTAGTAGIGAWHHFFATGDGSSAKLAIDGVIETFSGANGGINDSSAVPAGVGGTDDNGESVNGWIGELAIWDFGPFTDAQITALSRGVNPLKISDQAMIGYWPLRGTTLPMADLSGNGRHLTEHNVDPAEFSDPSFHPPVQFSLV